MVLLGLILIFITELLSQQICVCHYLFRVKLGLNCKVDHSTASACQASQAFYKIEFQANCLSLRWALPQPNLVQLYAPRKLASLSKGLLHLVTLVTKLLYVILFHEDITQPEPKTSRPWYTCDLSPHRVSTPMVQYFWRILSFSGDQSSVCIVWKACTALFIRFQELHQLV